MMKHGILSVLILAAFVAGSYLHYRRGCYLETNRQYHSTGSDDAYISFRYGWNLAHSGTLSWNASGFRHTEGFTNPAWVYLSAAAAIMNEKHAVYPIVAVLSVLVSAMLALVLLSAIRSHEPPGSGGMAGMAIMLISPIMWAHTTSGLESAVFGFLVAIVAYLSLTAQPGGMAGTSITIFTCLSVWVRSDGFVYILVVLIAAFVARSPHRRLLAASLLISFAGLVLWRWTVFGGYLAPNTSVAKLNGMTTERIASGVRFLVKVLFLKGFWIFPAAALAGMIADRDRRRAGAAIVLIGWVGYFVAIGGDYFLERHLLGAAILSASLCGGFWRRIVTPMRCRSRAILAAVVVGSLVQPMLLHDQRFLYFERKPHDPLIMLGDAVASDRAAFGVLVSAPAGKLPFFAGGDCIDPVGLNDPEIARITAPRFQPGHSSGSMVAALALAGSRGRSSYFTFFPARESDNRNHPVLERARILLWMDNEDPDGGVMRAVPPDRWEAAKQSVFTNWSVIARP